MKEIQNIENESVFCNKIGLFYQLNKTDEFILHYSLTEEERSLDEWMEMFSSNLYFMGFLGRLSLWTIDKCNNRINKIIDNHEIRNLLNNNKTLKDFLVEKAIGNEQNK